MIDLEFSQNPNLFKKPQYKMNYEKFIFETELLPDIERKATYQELCLTDTYFLLKYGCHFPVHVVDTYFCVERCKLADQRMSGEKCLDKWMIMVFRGGYKSTIFNYAVNIQHILRNPEEAICIFSFNKSLAVKHLKVIKGILETSDQLKDWFDNVLWEDPFSAKVMWNEENGIIVKRKGNRAEPTLYASGLVSGMPTGTHFDKLCYDDVVVRDSVKTKHSIDETSEAFKNSQNLCITTGDPQTWILGTFYKYGDTYCELLKTKMFKHEKVPWIDEDGNYLVHTNEAAEMKKKIQGRYDIATQMLLEPVPKEDMILDPKWMDCFNPAHINYNDLKFYIIADVATWKKESRNHEHDNTAIVVLGKDYFGNEYIVDGLYDKISRPESVNAVFDFVEKYKVSLVLWEQTAAQEDENWIKRMQAETGRYFKIKTFNPIGEKADRITGALVAPIEAKMLKFATSIGYRSKHEDKMIDLIDVYKDEMTNFPHGVDDLLDATAQRTKLPAYGNMQNVKKVENPKMSGFGLGKPSSAKSLKTMYL